MGRLERARRAADWAALPQIALKLAKYQPERGRREHWVRRVRENEKENEKERGDGGRKHREEGV